MPPHTELHLHRPGGTVGPQPCAGLPLYVVRARFTQLDPEATETPAVFREQDDLGDHAEVRGCAMSKYLFMGKAVLGSTLGISPNEIKTP